MIEVLSESEPVARKDHYCMASEWLLNSGIFDGEYSFAELREIVKAKRNGWKIKKGQRYIRQNNKYDGKLYTFKAIPAIDKICRDHDLYEV